jgi:fermentation-respiration switch protein FrsA (DUF1100 family)
MNQQPAKHPPTWRRRLLRWAVLLALTYLGVVVVLLALENSLVYHPAGPEDWQPAPSPIVHDVALTTADGTPIHGWWFPCQGSQDALLYFPGNAGNLSMRGGQVLELQEKLGVSALIIDYPGYGKSGGRVSEAGCYASADAAYAWLTETQHISTDKVLILGASLGGGVAVDLASRKPHRALILLRTFTSLPDVGQTVYPWLPVRWVMRNRFNSLSKLDKCRQPIFISHGTADELIPFAQGEKLYEAAHSPKQFLRVEGGDHNSAMPPEFFAELKAFLARTSSHHAPAGK